MKAFEDLEGNATVTSEYRTYWKRIPTAYKDSAGLVDFRSILLKITDGLVIKNIA